jgi:hypothetical protein
LENLKVGKRGTRDDINCPIRDPSDVDSTFTSNFFS